MELLSLVVVWRFSTYVICPLGLRCTTEADGEQDPFMACILLSCNFFPAIFIPCPFLPSFLVLLFPSAAALAPFIGSLCYFNLVKYYGWARVLQTLVVVWCRLLHFWYGCLALAIFGLFWKLDPCFSVPSMTLFLLLWHYSPRYSPASCEIRSCFGLFLTKIDHVVVFVYVFVGHFLVKIGSLWHFFSLCSCAGVGVFLVASCRTLL